MDQYSEQPQLKQEKQFFDHRGKFLPTPLEDKWMQSNISYNHANVLRGMHFQLGNYAQAKLVKVLQGSVVDVIVDLRRAHENPQNVPVYTYHLTAINNANNLPSLYIPKGFAHGFLTLENNTIFEYQVDAEYAPDSDRSINWKSFGVFYELLQKYGIPEESLLISEKDKEAPMLDEWINKRENVLPEQKQGPAQ